MRHPLDKSILRDVGAVYVFLFGARSGHQGHCLGGLRRLAERS